VDRIINWTLAAGAIALAIRSVRQAAAYVGDLDQPPAGVTLGDVEGILAQTGGRRRLYVEGPGLREAMARVVGGSATIMNMPPRPRILGATSRITNPCDCNQGCCT